MASSEKKHPIEAISDGIKTDLERLYRCPVVTEFPAGEEELKIPSIIIECVRIDPAKPVGNGQMRQKTFWEVRSILPAYSEGRSLQVDAAIMASEIAERVGNRRYYEKNGEAMIFQDSSPDNLTRKATNIEMWTSTFTCEIQVGRDDYELVGAYPAAQPEQRESYLAGRIFRP